jgi:hypothetical protein
MAGKGSGAEGCRGAEHGQTCTRCRTGAIAVRVALKSAEHLGRGDKVNRQAEKANLTKGRFTSLEPHAVHTRRSREELSIDGIHFRTSPDRRAPALQHDPASTLLMQLFRIRHYAE